MSVGAGAGSWYCDFLAMCRVKKLQNLEGSKDEGKCGIVAGKWMGGGVEAMMRSE